MADKFDSLIEEFKAMIYSVRGYADLPCVCVPSANPREGMTEESIRVCTPCHLESLFDETLEHARDQVRYIQGMAERHPSKSVKTEQKPVRKTNVVRFHPMGRKSQPQALWKD